MEDVHADELSSLLHTEQRIIEAEALRQVPFSIFVFCSTCELQLCAAPIGMCAAPTAIARAAHHEDLRGACTHVALIWECCRSRRRSCSLSLFYVVTLSCSCVLQDTKTQQRAVP